MEMWKAVQGEWQEAQEAGTEMARAVCKRFRRAGRRWQNGSTQEDLVDWAREHWLSLAAVTLFLVLEVGPWCAVHPILRLMARHRSSILSTPAVFVAPAALLVVLLAPPLAGASFVLMLSGYVFGFKLGCLIALAGTAIGEALAVCLARTALCSFLSRQEQRSIWLACCLRVMRATSIRYAILLRWALIPPSHALLLQMAVNHALLNTAVGFITALPKHLAFVLLGALLASVDTIPPHVLRLEQGLIITTLSVTLLATLTTPYLLYTRGRYFYREAAAEQAQRRLTLIEQSTYNSFGEQFVRIKRPRAISRPSVRGLEISYPSPVYLPIAKLYTRDLALDERRTVPTVLTAVTSRERALPDKTAQEIQAARGAT